ncbi:hypothetical protein OIU78_012302 [Salix suchowensis]|nr:hypothetical protein OIU78_012302 [Salix suchowensis]
MLRLSTSSVENQETRSIYSTDILLIGPTRFTKDLLLARLKAGYFGDTGCGLCKKMFLKGKKSRIYIVSALVDTKRLGLEKGGTRMAPEEVMGEMLQIHMKAITSMVVL